MNEQIKAIRNEIERLQEIHERNLKKPMERGRIGYAHGVVACCDRILSFIDSLETETTYDTQKYTPGPSVGIEDVARVQFASHAKVFDKKRKAVFDWEQFKEVAGIFYGFGKKNSPLEETDNEESNRPKLSDSSLENEMINYWGRIPDDKDLIDTARHFALWQKEQMMDEWLQDRDGCFWDGVEEGKKAMEKQMMKDAVEGLICATITGTDAISFLSPLPKELTAGDKVRIIIVKED